MLTTATEAHTAKHTDGLKFLCTQCKGVFPVPTEGATGYATKADDSIICYDCATKEAIEDLKIETRLTAYVSGDNKHITTWSGGRLMDVTGMCARRAPFSKGFRTPSGERYYTIYATDVHGAKWIGTGTGGGMYCRMRKLKGESK